MFDFDVAVKRVGSQHPDCFLDLFFGSEREIRLKGIEDSQIQIPEHRADKAWRVAEGERECAILLEAITDPDTRDFGRIKLKNAATEVSLKLPTITVLVYLRPGKYTYFPDRYEQEIGGLRNACVFARVLLWEHKNRILSGELKELAPFLPLFEENPEPGILKTANDLLERIEDPVQRNELKAVTALVASSKFSKEIIRQFIRVEPHMLKDKTIFTEWFEESRVEGKQEGLHEGRWLVLQKQIDKKFGYLSEQVKTALPALSDQTLDALAMDLLDLKSMEELSAWLSRAQNGGRN